MNIGITCYPTYGGSGVVATELGKKLAQAGHQVHFISYALPYRLNHFQANLFFHEVDIVKYDLFEHSPYTLSLATKMVEVAEQAHLDILHVHYAIPHATSAFLAREMSYPKKLKFVTTLHGTDITLIGSDPSFKKIVCFSIEESDGVTAVSHYLHDQTKAVFQVQNEIRVIPNFIPDDFITAQASADLKQCCDLRDFFVLTHISNFRPLKRVHDLIPVMEKLVGKFKVKLLMVGDGPDRTSMERLCLERNLSQQILFLGKQENVSEILMMTDVFVLPSGNESFGLAALEAMACGVPCITSDAGGLPEVNLNGITGFTCPVGDTDAMAGAVQTLLEDDQLRKQFGSQAKNIVCDRYSADKILPHYVSFYEEVLAR